MTQEIPIQRPGSQLPIAIEAIADRPVYHTVCRDCIMEALHTSLRAAASEERAHRRAHPDHELATAEVADDAA